MSKVVSLDTRMKEYEFVTKNHLTRRLPTIIRLDGVAFHTFTKGLEKPIDQILIKTMYDTAQTLCSSIQGCRIAYVQSDEISLLLTDYEKLTTSAWFDKNISKMTSVSASIATAAFNKAFKNNTYLHIHLSTSQDEELRKKRLKLYESKFDRALFDSRAFVLPKEEVANYFIWRQQDATKNAISSLGQSKFSHKELHKKNTDQIREMLFKEFGINFNDCPVYQKRGVCATKENYILEDSGAMRTRWNIDFDIPIFTKNREYVEQYLNNIERTE